MLRGIYKLDGDLAKQVRASAMLRTMAISVVLIVTAMSLGALSLRD